MTTCTRLERLLDYFCDLCERAEVRGIVLDEISPFEVEAWGERTVERQVDLDSYRADELRKLIPAFPQVGGCAEANYGR
jgi:hypothetical protein